MIEQPWHEILKSLVKSAIQIIGEHETVPTESNINP